MNIPPIWRALVDTLSARGFSAIIAGGAPRDWYLGDLARDVDVFVYPYVVKNSWETALQRVLGITEFIDTAKEAPYPWGILQARMQILDCVDLCILNEPMTPTQILESFDFGICQIATDGYRIHATSLFIRDATNKTITLDPQWVENWPGTKEEALSRARRHADKLSLKSSLAGFTVQGF